VPDISPASLFYSTEVVIGSICVSRGQSLIIGSGMWFFGSMYGAEHFHFNSSGPIVVYYGI